MSVTSLDGRKITRFAGLLESRQENPPLDGYTAVIEFDGSQVVLMSQTDCAEVERWPSDVVEIPIQFVESPTVIVGLVVSGMIHAEAREFSGRQLWLVLNSEFILGLVNTQRGTRLHVEPLISAPFVRYGAQLWDMSGAPITLDEIVLGS